MTLSRLLLLTFVFAGLGVAAELLLLGHFEDWPQIIPLALIGLGVAAAVWDARSGGPASGRFLGAMLLLMAASGIVGQVLHYRGNMEFELESDGAVGGWPLFVASMTGATPALAPGTMLLLAAVGYAYLRSRRLPA